MIHYGDVTKIKGSDVPAVDVISFGAPCQDLSVAGKRAGMKSVLMGDEETTRSGLFFEAIRIIKEMRENDRRNDGRTDNTCRPRYAVYENVAGAFSSNSGEDFRAVLEETAKVADKDAVIPGPPGGKWPYAGCIVSDGWSIAWRLHDSQWFGVPQRRKRICLLADFNGDTAGKVLFELQRETTNRDTEQAIVDIGTESRSEVQSVSKGLSGDIAQSGKEGERVAEDTERCAGEASYTLKIRGGSDTYRKPDGSIGTAGKGALVQTELSATLGVSQDQTLITVEQQKQIEDFVSGVNAEAKHQQDLIQSDLGVARTLAPGTHASGSHLTKTLVTSSINAGDNQQAVVYGIGSYDSNAMKSDNPHSGIYEADTSRTLDLNGGNPSCNQGGMAVVQGADVYNGELTGEKAATLTAASGASAAHSGPTVVQGFDAYNQASTGDVAMSLRNKAADSDHIPVVCIEGNGQRESHKGDGYKESDTMYTLNTVEQHAVCIENHPADSRVKIAEDGICQTLSSRMGTGGGNVPMVMETIGLDNHNIQINEDVSETLRAESHGALPMVMETYQETTGSLCASGYDKLGTQEAANDMFVIQSNWDGSQVSPTLTANNANGSQRMPDKENFNAVVQSMEVFHCTTEKDKVQTLKARDYKDPQCDAYGLDRASYNQGQNAQYNFAVDEEKIGTQVSKDPGAVCKSYQNVTGTVCARISAGTSNQLAQDDMFVANTSVVRRLTPMECERLQGFPDNWTNIGDWVDSKGKTHKGDSDSPRYKALGNSIALPFWAWMAERMVKYLGENPTMASLFDGIGGFPLVFSRCGCKPVWASEIEEFPIAVTKIRFPEEG